MSGSGPTPCPVAVWDPVLGHHGSVTTTPDLATEPTLHGRLVTLRPFREGDAEVMVAILSDPDVRRLTGSVATTAEAEQPEQLDDRLVRWCATRNEQTDRLDLAIVDAASGRLVGDVVLNQVDPDALTSNPRARRFYGKVGYVVTGVRPDALVFDGVSVAALDMAVDAEIWRRVHGR